MRYFYPKFEIEVEYLFSSGDKDKKTSLRSLGASNFFTDALDMAVIEKRASFSVHSAKDLPFPLDDNLAIAALTYGLDPRDVLVLRQGLDPDQPLPEKLVIATSSSKREFAVLEVAKNPIFRDLRGTIEERLKLLERKEADGVVVAEAALIRLGLTHLPRVFLSHKTTEGQGQLAVVCRKDDAKILELFSIIDSRKKRPRCYYLGIDPTNYQCPFPLQHLPVIKTRGFLSLGSDLAKKVLEAYRESTHIILTSPRTAQYLLDLFQLYPDSFMLAQSKTWLSIGPSTAKALKIDRINIKVAGLGESAEALVPLINEVKEGYILYLHSQLARTLVKKALEKSGLPFAAFAIYTTEKLQGPQISKLQEADELVVTSPSCVKALFEFSPVNRDKKITPIGPITAKALQKYLQGS